MTEPAQPTSYIGQSLRRREDYKFLTGSGRYVDDIKLPDTLYLGILRSPHAHAVITGIDISAARAAPGVRLALAGADLIEKIGNIKPNWVIPGTVVPNRPVMAVDTVRFVGECVALVVAETREAAYDALPLPRCHPRPRRSPSGASSRRHRRLRLRRDGGRWPSWPVGRLTVENNPKPPAAAALVFSGRFAAAGRERPAASGGPPDAGVGQSRHPDRVGRTCRCRLLRLGGRHRAAGTYRVTPPHRRDLYSG